MSKISNALLLLGYLENGRKYSIKDLATRLETSERMIRYYKEELEKAGIYIDTIMGPYGGYVLRQNVKLPTRRFSEKDYQFLKKIKVEKEEEELYQNLLNKVEADYLATKKEVIELQEEVRTTYNILMRAQKEKRKVKITYYSYKHGDIQRIIHPLEMFYYNTGWGCAAYCELRKDLRHFELSRIKEIELLEEKFK